VAVARVVMTAAAAARLLVLRTLGDEALRREHEARDRGGVLEGCANDLHGVDDALTNQVSILIRRGVVAEVVFAFLDLVDDDRAFEARVADDLAEGLLDGAADDVDAELLLVIDL